jgi:hypothetical protein
MGRGACGSGMGGGGEQGGVGTFLSTIVTLEMKCLSPRELDDWYSMV